MLTQKGEATATVTIHKTNLPQTLRGNVQISSFDHNGVFLGREMLGDFLTEQKAALAYNQAALKHFGDMAYQSLLGKKTDKLS